MGESGYLRRSLARQLANMLDSGYTTGKEAARFVENLNMLANLTGFSLPEVMADVTIRAEALLLESESLRASRELEWFGVSHEEIGA